MQEGELTKRPLRLPQRKPKRFQFTIRQLFVFVILASLALYGAVRFYRSEKQVSSRIIGGPERSQIKLLQQAIKAYVVDWSALPSLSPVVRNMESLTASLRNYYNPHVLDTHDPDGNGILEFQTIKGFSYEYSEYRDADGKTHAVLIDPGKDGLLGGHIDPARGFVSDNVDKNGDGQPDHADNLSEIINR